MIAFSCSVLGLMVVTYQEVQLTLKSDIRLLPVFTWMYKQGMTESLQWGSVVKKCNTEVCIADYCRRRLLVKGTFVVGSRYKNNKKSMEKTHGLLLFTLAKLTD